MVLTALGRALLAAVFVVGGLDAARNPRSKVVQAERITKPLVDRVPGFPADTAAVVRANALAQVVAGVALGTGVVPRAAAVFLGSSLVPTTLAGHPFWEERAPERRFGELIAFLDNAGLLGGLLIVAVGRGRHDR